MGVLKGKSALVTAAGQGIGRATALAMAEAGAQVIATDINAAALDTLADIPGLSTRLLDVTDAQAIADLVADISVPDILFNCAGYVANGTIMECDEADWDRTFDINVKSMYQMIQGFLPAMLDNGGASIINMSSVAGSIVAVPNRFAYATSKAAVIGLTKSVAADFVTCGIRCNAICPGTVETPSLHERLHATGDFDAARAAFIARQPIGRMAQADEIAGLAVWLASDAASYITGQNHVIDGGWTNT
ncbi:MAG: SDR family oxidoreductase [Rhodobacteraceae bacterium]|nr:SDR family oxidoreductase [Paracoccaceae bacterium]